MTGVSTFTVEEDEAGLRLDRWFRRRYPGLTHGRLEKLLRTGQIRLDGGRVKALPAWRPVRLCAFRRWKVPTGIENPGDRR